MEIQVLGELSTRAHRKSLREVGEKIIIISQNGNIVFSFCDLKVD